MPNAPSKIYGIQFQARECTPGCIRMSWIITTGCMRVPLRITPTPIQDSSPLLRAALLGRSENFLVYFCDFLLIILQFTSYNIYSFSPDWSDRFPCDRRVYQAGLSRLRRDRVQTGEEAASGRPIIYSEHDFKAKGRSIFLKSAVNAPDELGIAASGIRGFGTPGLVQWWAEAARILHWAHRGRDCTRPQQGTFK